MNKTFLFSIVLFLISFKTYSQQSYLVKGTVADTTGNPLAGAGVKLFSPADTLSTSADANGVFHFQGVRSPRFRITTMMIGFQSYSHDYKIADGNKVFETGSIQLKVQVNMLDQVDVTGVNPITIKEDTVQYDARAYKVREGAPVEDIVKKLPGVTVDKDGNITAEGKTISRVRVNGKDFFGGDVQTATQNLPADIIENLQIIDDYGDQANLTGIKDGDPEKILNINIQKGKKKGYFGNGTIAGGDNQRYLGHVMANDFREEQQISLLGSLNNTNANAFNFNGGGKGGGARGANFGSGERGGGGNGITNSQSVGLNYRDMWGKKISVYGSYSYSGRKNSTIGTSFQQDFNPMNTSTTSRNSDNNNNSSNQRLTWNMEYQIDTANYLKVSPYFSSSSSGSDNSNVSEINKLNYYTLSNGHSENNSSSPNAGSDLLFNHKFSKRGRNFSVRAGIDYSSRNQDRSINNSYENIDSSEAVPVTTNTYQYQLIGNDNRNTRSDVRASYVEPLSQTSFLELSYARNQSNTKSIRDVNDIDPETQAQIWNDKQSNDYNYDFITNRYGLTFRSLKEKYNYNLGIVAQPTHLEGNNLGRGIKTSRRNFNWIPTARFVYKFAKRNMLTITYGGSSREPNFSQLQPVRDSSNLKNIVIGNPDLDAEFTNRFSLRYNKFDVLSGNSFFSNLSFDRTSNKIVSSRVNDPAGTGRTTTYLNADGFFGVNGDVSYSKPFADRKYTITVRGNASFDNNISFTDNQRNKGQNWLLRPGARFRADLEDIIDASLNVNYSVNSTTTKYATYSNTSKAQTLSLGMDGENYFFKDWTLGYSFSKLLNYGYRSGGVSNPNLLNVYVEYRFLKNNMGTLRLQGYDLFNQNTGISRTVNGTTITDSENNRLGRYFLFSFNLRLKKFGGHTFRQNQNFRGGDRNRGGGFRRNE